MNLVSRLESLDYKVFNAEKINASPETATNLLALPPCQAHLYQTLFDVWQQELEIWQID